MIMNEEAFYGPIIALLIFGVIIIILVLAVRWLFNKFIFNDKQPESSKPDTRKNKNSKTAPLQ